VNDDRDPAMGVLLAAALGMAIWIVIVTLFESGWRWLP
jgi:hypothetical protein